MNFHDTLSPYVFQIHLLGHSFGVRWYGLAYLTSFVLGYVFLRRAALRKEVPGLSMVDAETLAVYLVAGVMVGGRLGFVIQHPQRLIHDPLFLVAIWEGGMAFFGGLAGVMLAVWIFCRQRGLSWFALADVCALPAAMGLALGRIANFINGELYGKLTHARWGVVFPGAAPLGQPRHPSQLYESATHFILFGILYVVYERLYGRSEGKRRPGVVAWLFLTGYGIFRVITDFWRDDDVYWGPLSDGQWFSVGVAVLGLIGLILWIRQGRAAATRAPLRPDA